MSRSLSSTGSLILGAHTVAREFGRIRVAAGQTSLRRFMQVYLPEYAKVPFSRMHHEMFAHLGEARTRRGLRLAIAAPRGHAKSTVVSLGYVLWCIVYQVENHILLLSDTADQAASLLSYVKHELETNVDLRADFPQACAVPPVHARPARWRKGDIITGNGVKVTALGVDSKVRGRRHNQHRPGLIIVDDAENDESVRNPEQRQRLSEWFDRAVLKAGTAETNTIVMGTIFHYASLLARLTDPERSPGWTGLVYRAVEVFADRTDLWDRWESVYAGREEIEGASGPVAAQAFYEANEQAMLEGSRVLWPAREDYLALMKLRLCDGRASFDSEKQNQPGATGDCCFMESDFVFWDGHGPGQFGTEEELLSSLTPGYRFFGACDPSLGKAGNNRDDCGLITVVKDLNTKVIYVLDADIRKRRPDEIIAAVIEYHRRRGYIHFSIETNQFQQFLADELIKRSRAAGCPVPVWGVHHSTDKLGRMQKLQPLISSGRVRLSRRHVTLLEQLRQFPHAAHDDGPDALEMAVEKADRYRPPSPPGRIMFGSTNGRVW